MSRRTSQQNGRVSHSQEWNAAVESIAALSFRQHAIVGEYAETIALTRGAIDSSIKLLRETAKSFPDRPQPP